VIALPNDASIRLHERFGFTKVAHLDEIGFKFGQWIDVGYWQRPLSWAVGRRPWAVSFMPTRAAGSG
jgi:phosphinothricin acetyltransferase